MSTYPSTVPAQALPAVGCVLGHSASPVERPRQPRGSTAPCRASCSLPLHDPPCPAISQSWRELTRSERKDTSHDNPMDSGLSDGVSKGACARARHRVVPRLLAPKGLLSRLSLLKIQAKVYAHVLLDTDLLKWKDVFLSVERFLWCFKLSQSGTTVIRNMLGFGTLFVEGKPCLRMAGPRNLLF